MEATNDCLSLPLSQILDQDFAIRRFCPARMELLQPELQWDEKTTINEFELIPPTAPELDELVDSFINADQDTEQDHPKGENLTFSMLEDVFSHDGPMVNESVEDIVVPRVEEVSHRGVDRGLHLVHLLLACAEAVACRDAQLANSILSQISGLVNPWGDPLQRVSHCFATGLKSRLLHLQNADVKTDLPLISMEEKMEAFHLLYQTTPYIAFGFMAANEAISQSARGKDSIHVVDLGMGSTLQWPSLIRTLASRPEGPPRVRITGFVNGQNRLQIESNMKTLVEDGKSLGISLDYSIVSEPVTPEFLTRENLKLQEGEELFFNSIMQLHKFVKESRGSLKGILQTIKKLKPTLLTVVEQDANHNGPFFIGRFLESLHYYSAIFDSLEASLPRNSQQRVKIEWHHFGEEIVNIVDYEGSERTERHERAGQWRRQLGRAGFRAIGLKCMSQVRMMLSVYGCDGYSLESEKGCLLLRWKGRPIMMASAWQLHNVDS